jgi:3,4-dihydroxy 2-butanone 4-phosphate synthase/GTP cyclohydrolase II
MSSLSVAIDRLKAGRMVILVDDEGRENEGDLVFGAEFATGESITFMAVHARGLICLALEEAAVQRLGLPSMVSDESMERKSAFTVSIEARIGVTTGISALDRALTIQAASAPDATARDIVSPGHVFPLRAVAGGVLSRDSHTEGSVDLMRIAGLRPAAVICRVMKNDGEMAHMEDLRLYSERHDIPIVSIAEVVSYRMAHETLVDEIAVACLPTAHAPSALEARAYRNRIDGREYLALVKGIPGDGALVRVHSECLTGDALGSLRCDCGAQLQASLRLIGNSDCGILIYLHGHEGRGVGLANKIRAYALQDQGMDTVEANNALGFADDLRNYGVAAQILKCMSVSSVRLLTNNPLKAAGLRGYGIAVCEEIPLRTPANPHNLSYLLAKRDKLGHNLSLPTLCDRSVA